MSENVDIYEADGLTTLELDQVLPLTASVDTSKDPAGHLCIGGVDLCDLAKEYGTPLYVMDEQHIRTRLREYQDGLSSEVENVRVCYAIKSFACTRIAKIVDEEGCCMLVASGGELALALKAGFPADRIIMHGSNKSRQEIQEALEAGISRVVADSFFDIDNIEEIAASLGKSAQVLLRIRPGIVADTHSYIQTAQEDSKFGVSVASGEAMRAIKHILECPHIQLMGFQAHIGSQIFRLVGFDKEIESVMDFALWVREETGFEAKEIDLGGGLGIAYTLNDRRTPVYDFTSRVARKLRDICAANDFPMPLLAVEPGRSISGSAGVTIYTTGAIKEIPGIRTIVSVDGGMSDNIRSCLYGAKYEAVLANKAAQERTSLMTIAGKHCESGDILIDRASLQEVEPGDILCIFSTGAYCYTMSSNYNLICKPAVVFVKDGKASLAIRRQTYDDLFICEVED